MEIPTYSMKTGVGLIEEVTCDVCGCVIHNREAHDNWHETIRRMIDGDTDGSS
jgi:hypothetical protein